MNEILTRTSVRSFTAQQVEPEKVELLLKAAMQAPSAGNQQSWEFIVVNERQQLDELVNVSPYANSLKSAPMAIVMLNNTTTYRFGDYAPQDLGACAQNIQLMCEHLGLGAVWLGVMPDQDRMDFISKFYDLPKEIEPFAILSIGYPQTKKEATSRYDASRVGYNGYKKAEV